MTEFIKFTVQVETVREIVIELPASFGSEEYLQEFNKSLWPVDGIEDIAMYAARLAADMGGGYEHDGLGLLSEAYSRHPRAPDVKFTINYENTEAEIVGRPESAAS